MIDTHCHLDSEAFGGDLESVLGDSRKAGVGGWIIPAADPADIPRARELAEREERVCFAVGVHPYHVEEFDLAQIKQNQAHPKCVAIGECGLDYFRLPEDGIEAYKECQRQCFIAQIELAIQVDKPLILHVREASAEVLEILRAYPKARGVLHCFNADAILLELQERFYYGIGGVLTFKNARRLIEVLPRIPLDRLLLETDAPYLTPHPFRGQRNEPKYIPLVLEKMAEVLGVEKGKIMEQCRANTQRLFNFFL